MKQTEKWVQLQVAGATVIVPADVGMKIFQLLSTGEGIYIQDYDWRSEQRWIEPIGQEACTLKIMPPETFAIMKLVGATKMEEKEAERIAKVNAKESA